MKAIIYLCAFLLICSSSWGQARQHTDKGKNIVFANAKDKMRISTFLNYKKVAVDSVVCKLPAIHVDYYCLYQVTISREIAPAKYFYVYVGLDMNNRKKYISVDTNTDNDFRNDSIYTISLDDYSKYDIQENPMNLNVKVKFTYSSNEKLKEYIAPISIIPFYSDKGRKNCDSEKDYFLDIGIFAYICKEGFFTFDNEKYHAYATKKHYTDLLPWTLSQDCSFDFYYEGKYLYSDCALGDTIVLNDKMVLLESTIGDSLNIREVGNFITSCGLNDSSPDILVHSLYDDHKVRLQDVIRGKYVFIDFWGSWCGPCIQSIPLVKQLFVEVKDRSDVIVLGIALENKANLGKLKKVIADLKIPYDNYLVYRDESMLINYPHKFWGVQVFPTYLILDKNGNVVLKMDDSRNTEKVISSFLNLIDSANN